MKIETKEGYKFMGCVFCDKAFNDRMEVRRPLEPLADDTRNRSGHSRYFDSAKPSASSTGFAPGNSKPFSVH